LKFLIQKELYIQSDKMLKKLIVLVLVCASVFANCQIPNEPITDNYATNFDYAQELKIAAECFQNEGENAQAISTYKKSIGFFQTSLNYLNSGTDFKLRAGVYEKMGGGYEGLVMVDAENELGHQQNADHFYELADIEMNNVPDYWIYIISGIGIIIIILIGFFTFKKKEFKKDFGKVEPTGHSIKVEVPEKRIPEPPKPRTPAQIKLNVKEKYRERLRKKHGL